MLFSDEDKKIFPYILPDGSKRFADPLRIRRWLAQLTAGRIDELLNEQCSDDEQTRFRADEALIPATAQAFGLGMFNPDNGQGCTDKYLLDLLDEFVGFLQSKKKNIETQPTCALPTG
jgi:hypothetical protein